MQNQPETGVSPMFIPESERVSLSVRNLNVYIKKQSKFTDFGQRLFRSKDLEHDGNGIKKVLDDVNLDVSPGEVIAVLGESGSGKTTLLNTLAHRVQTGSTFGIDGVIQYGDTSDIQKLRYAYLLQTDMFLPTLTLYELLKFAADLKLPEVYTRQEKELLIETILDNLGLNFLRDEVICDSLGRMSLSGGERRLVSLALQLLNKPSLLFLDEPTTGLDANKAYKMMSVVHSLAKDFGITCVLTIHQPRTEILEKLDKLCLLAKGGRTISYGSLQDSIDHFAKQGFELPAHVNVADFLIDLSVRDFSSPENELISQKRINELACVWKQIEAETLAPVPPISKESKFKSAQNKKVGLVRETMVLTKRSFVLAMRDKFSLITLNGGLILLSIVCGWLFYKPGNDLGAIRTKQSQLYAVLEVIGFSPMTYEIARLWTGAGKIFFRERSEGIISVTGWVVSRRLAQFWIEDFPISLAFSLITYFMFGLRIEGSASYFMIYFATCLLVYSAGAGCGIMCFSLGRDIGTSGLVSNIFYQVQNSACGFFINAKTMPVYVRWIKYLAYFWYAFGALCSSQFTNWEGSCASSDEECTGDYVLQTLGYGRHWVPLPLCILLAFYVGFLTIGVVLLYFRPNEVSMSTPKDKPSIFRRILGKTKSNKADQEVATELSRVPVSLPSEGLDIRVSISLWVLPVGLDLGIPTIIYNWVIYKLKGKSGVRKQRQKAVENGRFIKQLLDDVNVTFKPGTVNAIMGPSGSGKSTLLNFIAGRSSAQSKFYSSGNITLNNVRLPEGSTLEDICSYVVQHNDDLLPTLTVKETLRSQARLRMKDASNIEPFIQKLIYRMGLEPSENVLVGDDVTKGISGGEKKRLAIAIQLLDDSQVLLLDEPTSGLDSATSASILELLGSLATEFNKTIILTIHQPKYELFEQFGEIVLLTKGGRVAYNGKVTGIIEYFMSQGFECPRYSNFADYILDIVSKDTMIGTNETPDEADARVKGIISFWESQRSKEIPEYKEGTLKDFEHTEKTRFGLKRSLPAVLRRDFLTTFRNRTIIDTRFIQILALCVVHSLFFAPLKSSYDGISNRLGLIQEIANLYYVGFISNVTAFPGARNVFYMESEDGIYGVTSFFVSYLALELPFEIVGSILFSIFIVLVIGLPRTAGMFFITVFNSFAMLNAGDTLGITINIIFTQEDLAFNVMANLSIVAIFMAGTMSIHMPSFFQAWNWLNPTMYAVKLMATLGFDDQHFSCEYGETCSLTTGSAVLDEYKMHCDIAVYSGVLVALIVGYRLVAYCLLVARMKLNKKIV
ncbi:unnamed protein product [Kuraishia capsulata CBS 1993]|uniref:ABC transporter domain-containing protein n=1 Tax=Kuraishia capsulata CBS 1993 TaxID=1382522 RepID=W6MR98_9ASCO|nr:uncharacterized protein KUCA_T00004873001 [Kuraishia capsulata CBS 1993]CDK28888.1 unnamed protein product [Kuraishia capsulata CBS 1993]